MGMCSFERASRINQAALSRAVPLRPCWTDFLSILPIFRRYRLAYYHSSVSYKNRIFPQTVSERNRV